MNWKKIKEKYFIFLFTVYVSFTISFLLGFLFINELFELYNAIYFNTIIFIVLHNIDIRDRELLDEYLYLICIAITWGLFFSDIIDFLYFLQQIDLLSYFMGILVYLFIMILINKIIRTIVKKRSYQRIDF